MAAGRLTRALGIGMAICPNCHGRESPWRASWDFTCSRCSEHLAAPTGFSALLLLIVPIAVGWLLGEVTRSVLVGALAAGFSTWVLVELTFRPQIADAVVPRESGDA
jgi:hypothetical protein